MQMDELSFGYASLRPSDSDSDSNISPIVRSSAEIREMLRKRQEVARYYQEKNQDEFEENEIVRKMKLRQTLTAWDEAIVKMKKSKSSSSGSGLSREVQAGSVLDQNSASAIVQEIKPVVAAQQTLEISSQSPNSKEAVVIPCVLSEEELRVHSERFRERFPFFRSDVRKSGRN